MSLSIPEIPPDTIDGQHPRHVEPGDHLVLVAEDAVLLVAEHGAHGPDFEKASHGLGDRSLNIARAQRKVRMSPEFEDSCSPNLEVSPWKAFGEIVRVVQLGPTLVLWAIWPVRVPLCYPGVDPDAAEDRTTDRCRPGRDSSGAGGKQERVVDDRSQSRC